MDPEGWKMSVTAYNFLKHGKETILPKSVQVNHMKYTNMERMQKRISQVGANEIPEKLEGKMLQPKTRMDYGSGFTPSRQSHNEMGKLHPEGNTMTSASKYGRWNAWIPDSVEHIENVAFTNYKRKSQSVIKPGFGVPVKTFPIQIKDNSCTFLHREDEKPTPSITPAYTKEPPAVFCQKEKIHRNKRMATVDLTLRGQKAEYCEESGLPTGIPFCYSRKKTMIHNNTSQSHLTESWKRIKITAQEIPVHSKDKMHRGIYDKHNLFTKERVSVSTAFAYKGSSVVSNRTSGNVLPLNTQSDKFIRNTAPCKDKVKLEPSVIKPMEKSFGNKKYRRFLLIDSQGLPYTEIVEEPKMTNINKLATVAVSDSSYVGPSKSVAPRKVYKCPVCFRIFEYLSYLQRHSIAHSQQKPHVCKICGKAFKRSSHLTRHSYTHFGGKPCECKICHCRFYDAEELLLHEKIHNEERS